jgi:hypothetical protein
MTDDEELHRLVYGPSEERAKREAAANPDAVVIGLAKVSKLKYAQRRKDEAKKLGITVGQLDQAVREQRKQSASQSATLPHWEVETSRPSSRDSSRCPPAPAMP